VLKDRLEIREWQVPLEYRELLVPLGNKERPERKDLKDILVILVGRVYLGILDRLAQLAILVKADLLAHLAFRVPLDSLDTRVLLDLLAQQEQVVLREQLVLLVSQDHKVKLAFKETLEIPDSQALVEALVLLGRRDYRDQLVLLDRLVLRVLKVSRVQLEIPAHLARLERQDSQVGNRVGKGAQDVLAISR
jgi:hypothetical protein